MANRPAAAGLRKANPAIRGAGRGDRRTYRPCSVKRSSAIQGGLRIPIRIHPRVPAGTIIGWAENLPIRGAILAPRSTGIPATGCR